MGGGKSKAPAAPNYEKLAQNEAVENRKTAQELTAWNRPTQNNPFGQVSWDRQVSYSPEQEAERRKLTKQMNKYSPGSAQYKQYQQRLNAITGTDNWTQNETWDPRIMEGYDKLFEAQKGAYEGLPGAFEGGPAMPQYDEAYRKQYEQDMYDSVMNRARPEQERQQAQFTTRLRQQGLQPGTEAFDRAMQNMMTSHGDVNTQAALQARMEGGNQARQEYTTALQGQNQAYGQAKDIWGSAFDRAGAVQGLMGGQYRPTFQGFSGATGYNPADMMGAANAGYQSKMGEYNAGQQKKGNTMNTAVSAGTTIGAAMM